MGKTDSFHLVSEAGVAPQDSPLPCCESFGPVTRRRFMVSVLAAIASSCAGPTMSGAAQREQDLFKQAADLARRAVSVDLIAHAGPLAGKNAFSGASRDISAVVADMRVGHLDVALFSAHGDRPVIQKRRQVREPRPGELFAWGQSQLHLILASVKNDTLMLARSPADVLVSKQKGVPCALLAFEGADPLEEDLSRVKLFYDLGVRCLQLVHHRINELGDIQIQPPRHGGLTPFGRDVVREMNRLGMVVDLAHASFATVQGVLAESRHPVMDSHTRPAALGQSPRFRSDDELRALAKRGGVVGLLPVAQKGETFDTFLKNLDHVISVVGVDHVGIGTDMNGLGDNTVIPTHKEFALIPAALLARGDSESDVAKIIGGNFMRLFGEVTANQG